MRSIPKKESKAIASRKRMKAMRSAGSFAPVEVGNHRKDTVYRQHVLYRFWVVECECESARRKLSTSRLYPRLGQPQRFIMTYHDQGVF